MAVTLTSDIVADVMRAATPERVQAARDKLRSLSASAAGFGAGPVGAGTVRQQPDQAAAYQKFDSMVLGSFVETMLPKETESVYGGGFAGDMWKSLMAQQIGDTLAARGALPIASRYIGDHYADGDLKEPLRGVADPAVRAATDGQAGLSRSLIDELQRKALDAMSGTAG